MSKTPGSDLSPVIRRLQAGDGGHGPSVALWHPSYSLSAPRPSPPRPGSWGCYPDPVREVRWGPFRMRPLETPRPQNAWCCCSSCRNAPVSSSRSSSGWCPLFPHLLLPELVPAPSVGTHWPAPAHLQAWPCLASGSSRPALSPGCPPSALWLSSRCFPDGGLWGVPGAPQPQPGHLPEASCPGSAHCFPLSWWSLSGELTEAFAAGMRCPCRASALGLAPGLCATMAFGWHLCVCASQGGLRG